MSMPDLGPFAQELYECLEPFRYAEEQTDYALAKYCKGIAEMFEEMEELVHDTDTMSGWGLVMDPTLAPVKWLPWLGQFVGVKMDERIRSSQFINLVRNPSVEHASQLRFENGSTAGAVVEAAAAKSTAWEFSRLSSVYIRLRNPDNLVRFLSLRTPNASGERFPVVAGMTYFAAVQLNVIQFPAGDNVRIAITWVNGAGNIISTVEGPGMTSGEGRLDMSAVAPSTAETAYMGVVATANATNERLEVYADDWMFVQTEEPLLDYFDGQSTSSAWLGTVDASASELTVTETEDAYWARQRQRIVDHIGYQRGTRESMIKGVKSYLMGSQSVFFVERDPTAYSFDVIVYQHELMVDAEIVETVLRRLKPAGLIMSFSTTSGMDYAEILGFHPDYQDVFNVHTTYAEMLGFHS